MIMNKAYKKLMESRMHALPRYSLLIALAFTAPAVFAQDAAPVEETAAVAVENAEKEEASAALPEDAEALKASVESLLDEQADDESAEAFLQKGTTAYQKSEFDKAVDYYLKSLDILLKGDDGLEIPAARAKKIETVKTLIGQSYYNWSEKTFAEAEELADIGEYDLAIEQCNKALEYFPQSKAKADEYIAKYERMKSSAEYRKEASRDELIPDFTPREKRIALLLRQGQMMYQTEQWAKAQEKYTEVLAIDTYNVTAIDALRRIYIKQLEAGRRRRGAVILERHAESMWNMIAPIVTHTQSAQEADINAPITKIDLTGNTQKKLNEITIEHIEFDNVSIAQVVQFLKHISKDKDPDHVGVNFVLRFNTDAAASASAETTTDDMEDMEGEEESYNDTPAGAESSSEEPVSDDVFGGGAGSTYDEYEDGTQGDSTIQTLDNTVVSLSVENVSLFNAIRYICKSANLHFRVEEYAVVIAGNDVPLDEFVRKTFPVEQEVIGLNDFAGENVKNYFVDRGVPFPTGSTIRFDSATSRLTVYNTPEALDLIDELIEELNVSDPQVLIQVKFVEVMMKDVQELSFEYSFGRPAPSEELYNQGTNFELAGPTMNGDNNEPIVYHGGNFVLYDGSASSNAANHTLNEAWARSSNTSSTDIFNASNITVHDGDMYYIPENGDYYRGAVLEELQGQFGSAITWGANSRLVRFAEGADSSIFGSSVAVQNDTMFSWSTYNAHGYMFSGAIHALDNADSTEILSAPRVTTMNHENAIIRMVTDKYYPSSWEEAELETVSSNGNNIPVFTPSIPQFGGATQEGIALQVRPNVDEDNYTIELEMTPVIQEFIGWTDYSYSIPLGENNELYPNTLKMPIIESRMLNTSAMSFDGETIVLGGVIKDQLSVLEDQYPILGDLPVIGRFFQAKGKGSDKTNLLIFLTSRLIKPDGTPFRVEQGGRGVPSI